MAKKVEPKSDHVVADVRPTRKTKEEILRAARAPMRRVKDDLGEPHIVVERPKSVPPPAVEIRPKEVLVQPPPDRVLELVERLQKQVSVLEAKIDALSRPAKVEVKCSNCGGRRPLLDEVQDVVNLCLKSEAATFVSSEVRLLVDAMPSLRPRAK